MDGYPVARLQSLAEEPPRHDGGRLVQSPVRHVFVAAEQRGLLWVPLRVTVEGVNQGHERWIIPSQSFVVKLSVSAHGAVLRTRDAVAFSIGATESITISISKSSSIG